MNYNINLQDIVDELDFDLEEVEMILESFFKSLTKSLKMLEEAIDNNDFEEIFKHAHAIKGSSANITLKDISAIAKDMEYHAGEKMLVNYVQKYDNLKKLVDEIYNKLNIVL